MKGRTLLGRRRKTYGSRKLAHKRKGPEADFSRDELLALVERVARMVIEMENKNCAMTKRL